MNSLWVVVIIVCPCPPICSKTKFMCPSSSSENMSSSISRGRKPKNFCGKPRRKIQKNQEANFLFLFCHYQTNNTDIDVATVSIPVVDIDATIRVGMANTSDMGT